MKKLLAIILMLTVMLSCFACGKQEASKESEGSANKETNTTEEALEEAEGDGLTLSAIQAAETKEELAALIGVKDVSDMKQMLVYLKNFNYTLPSEDDSAEVDKEWKVSEDGLNYATFKQVRTMITPTVVTTENWKDYFGAYTETIHVNYEDEDGNVVDEYEEQASIGILPGFNTDSNAVKLVFTNNITGAELKYEGYGWPEQVALEDGKYYAITFDDDENEIRNEFNVDDYTCTFADCIVYEYEIDPEICYVESMDEDWNCIYVHEDEADFEYEDYEVMACIQYKTEDEICFVGIGGVGEYAYASEFYDFYRLSQSTSKPVTIDPTEDLTLEFLQGLKTSEELASALGVSDAANLYQILTYLENYYYHIPTESEKDAEVDMTWLKTEEGYNALNHEQIKAMTTPTVVTKENWKDYVMARMYEVDCEYIDEDGNSTYATEERPEVGLDEKYDISWDNTSFILRNEKNGEIISFDGRNWPESVYYENDEFTVTVFDQDGFGKSEVFDINNYTCLYVNCVLYEFDPDPALRYVDYYDEDKEEFFVVQAEDYEGGSYGEVIFVWDEEYEAFFEGGVQSLGEGAYRGY